MLLATERNVLSPSRRVVVPALGSAPPGDCAFGTASAAVAGLGRLSIGTTAGLYPGTLAGVVASARAAAPPPGGAKVGCHIGDCAGCFAARGGGELCA